VQLTSGPSHCFPFHCCLMVSPSQIMASSNHWFLYIWVMGTFSRKNQHVRASLGCRKETVGRTREWRILQKPTVVKCALLQSFLQVWPCSCNCVVAHLLMPVFGALESQTGFEGVSSSSPVFFFFFFFWLDWSFNSGPHTCKAGALLLEPWRQSILLWLFWAWGLTNCLPGL
jgi:hypothetical protein